MGRAVPAPVDGSIPVGLAPDIGGDAPAEAPILGVGVGMEGAFGDDVRPMAPGADWPIPWAIFEISSMKIFTTSMLHLLAQKNGSDLRDRHGAEHIAMIMLRRNLELCDLT
jgi:hypothetical protein